MKKQGNKKKQQTHFYHKGSSLDSNFNVLQDGMVNTEWSLLYSAMLSVFEWEYDKLFVC